MVYNSLWDHHCNKFKFHSHIHYCNSATYRIMTSISVCHSTEGSRQAVDLRKCCLSEGCEETSSLPPSGCPVPDVPSSICSPFPRAQSTGPLSGRERHIICEPVSEQEALQRYDFKKGKRTKLREAW